MYLLLVSKEGHYMKVKVGFNARKWAIPFSIEIGRKLEPATVGFLCFRIEFWTSRKAGSVKTLQWLMDEQREVEEVEAAMSVGDDDNEDAFDDELEDEEAEETEQPV